MSEFGYYTLETSQTLTLGEENKKELETIAVLIRNFLDLKPLPDKFSEANLCKTMPTSTSKKDREALREEMKKNK
jgi:hypothetical protein